MSTKTTSKQTAAEAATLAAVSEAAPAIKAAVEAAAPKPKRTRKPAAPKAASETPVRDSIADGSALKGKRTRKAAAPKVEAPKEEKAPRTTCKRGHDLTDDANVIVWASAGNARRCRACYDLKRADQKIARDARKAAEKAAEAEKAAKAEARKAARKPRKAAPKRNALGGISETVTKEAPAAVEAPAEA